MASTSGDLVAGKGQKGPQKQERASLAHKHSLSFCLYHAASVTWLKHTVQLARVIIERECPRVHSYNSGPQAVHSPYHFRHETLAWVLPKSFYNNGALMKAGALFYSPFISPDPESAWHLLDTQYILNK